MKYDKLLFDRYFEDWTRLPVDKFVSLLRVKAKTILPSLDAKDVDLSKKQNIKLGIDPTASDIHIGHVCPIIVLNMFLKAGHHVDFVIGDFTAKVGDPSGRVSDRAVITDDQITENFKTYKEQISKYIDTNKISVRRNSEWLAKTSSSELFYIFQNLNLATAMQRDDFRARLEKGGITVAEVCYASLMALDSVNLNTNIELGGLDQLLNFMQCREIQVLYGQKPEVAFTVPILEGLAGDGRKMSKSFNNYIAVNASAEDKFGKFMSLPDSLLLQYFKFFGYLYEDELKDLEKFIKDQPMEAKKQLATYFVALEAKDFGAGAAERTRFENKFSKKELQKDDFVTLKVKKGTALLDVLFSSGKFASKGELKRLLAGNGIKDIDKNAAFTADVALDKPVKIKAGKLNFFEIIFG